MSHNKILNVIIFGIGNVGSTLIRQINAERLQLQQRHNVQIRIPIVTNSKLAFFDKEGISNIWEYDFKTFSVPYKIDGIIQFVKTHNFENLIAIDATASSEFTKHYISLIQNRFHIVSANKEANAKGYDFYEELRFNLKKYNKQFLYETNVGAGLPVIETIKSLYDSGEKIKKIRGVFSGSLSYIFNEFSSSNQPFSKVLQQAINLGLTEPDARKDLSGNDVARKLLILARELNLKAEFHDISVESLVPKKLNDKTKLHQFKTRVKELDQPLEDLKNSIKENAVLRYIGELDVVDEKLDVKLISENIKSSIGQLKGADVIFAIYTESYGENPIVIQGAGAGKVVTARGLFSDIIKLSNRLN
jgi:homoserine dehydrogenase